MISSVEEEAGKVFERMEIVESNYEVIKKELKECNAEMIKKLEESNVQSDQIILDRIREAFHLALHPTVESLKVVVQPQRYTE